MYHFPLKSIRQGSNPRQAIQVYLTLEFPNITESCEILAHYLLGQRFSDNFVEQVLLVNDCGWSIFFDAIDATDPSDVSICNLRMLVGVPLMEDASKDRVVKDRVLDGPTELSFSHSDSSVLKADWLSNASSVNFFPGVSTAKRGEFIDRLSVTMTLFFATQSFPWNFRGHRGKDPYLRPFKKR